MRRVQMAWAGVGLLSALFVSATPLRAQEPPVQERFVYVCPMAGMWSWDVAGLNTGTFDGAWAPLVGVRTGYAPLRSLAVEVTLLHGSNDIKDAEPGTGTLDATSLQVSGVVFFRGLGVPRLYPILSLGMGYGWQSGGAVVGEATVEQADHLTFHLGLGARGEISRVVCFRVALQDAFYSRDERISANDQSSAIVDMVEVSAGLEFRFPLGKRKNREKLR